MTIQLINPIDHPNWNDQLSQLFPGAGIFHTANWAIVLAVSYNFKPIYFTSFEDRQISGCIPCMEVKSFLTGRRGIALPFTDECHPLCPDPATFERLWHRAKIHARQHGWRHIEMRGQHASLSDAPSSSTFVVHDLEISGSEQNILNQLRDSTRRNIKKAENSDVQVYRLHSLEAVKKFYQLNCLTRKSHGLPPQPYAFFKALYRHLIAKNMGFVQLAVNKNKTIAAAIFLHFNKHIVFKYGASDKNHQSLRANNLIIWKTIQWALENGYTQLSLGRTDPSNHGLLQFKRGWGGKEKFLAYYRYVPKAGVFMPDPPKLKNSYSLLRRLPMPLLKVTGHLLYRHIG